LVKKNYWSPVKVKIMPAWPPVGEAGQVGEAGLRGEGEQR